MYPNLPHKRFLAILCFLCVIGLFQTACPPISTQEPSPESSPNEPTIESFADASEKSSEQQREEVLRPDLFEKMPEKTQETIPETRIEATPEATAEPLLEAQVETIPEPSPPQKPYVLMMQTNGTITSYALNLQSGALQQRATTQRTGNMTFLAFHPKQPLFYATNRDKTQAFSFNPQDGKMAYLGEAANNSEGNQATHLTVDPSGRYLFVASYGGNHVAMHPIDQQGLPLAPTFSKGGKNDQTFCIRAHQARVHPNGRFVYVPCLGSNHILHLQLDPTNGQVTPQPPTPTQAGAGPRHLDFHPTRDVLYVVNETASTVNAYQIAPQTGKLTELQSITTLPQGTTTPSRSSDIHVSPDGRFVYAVNREPLNQIAIFSVQTDGKLAPLGHISTAGNHARSFALHATSPWLFLVNAKSQDLVTFGINADGTLKQMNQLTGISSQPWFVGTWDWSTTHP